MDLKIEQHALEGGQQEQDDTKTDDRHHDHDDDETEHCLGDKPRDDESWREDDQCQKANEKGGAICRVRHGKALTTNIAFVFELQIGSKQLSFAAISATTSNPCLNGGASIVARGHNPDLSLPSSAHM